jgi:hypothetical protein
MAVQNLLRERQRPPERVADMLELGEEEGVWRRDRGAVLLSQRRVRRQTSLRRSYGGPQQATRRAEADRHAGQRSRAREHAQKTCTASLPRRLLSVESQAEGRGSDDLLVSSNDISVISVTRAYSFHE